MLFQLVSVSGIILVSILIEMKCKNIIFCEKYIAITIDFFFLSFQSPQKCTINLQFLVLKHVEAVDSALGPDPVQALAIGLIVYLTCYICQRLFHLTICTWYIKNSMQQFIDICSMSNISVFIFCLNSFGFYIHGR